MTYRILIFKLGIYSKKVRETNAVLSDCRIPLYKGKDICGYILIYAKGDLVTLWNEKYIGDVLLRKSDAVDLLNKKWVQNKSIVSLYYVENSHESIIL